MKLRPAQPDDLSILLAFEQGVIEEERPCNDAIRKTDVKYYDLDGLIADPNASLQVVELDGRIVGCGYAKLRQSEATYMHDQHAYLGFMYVEPNFRRQGINKLIIESLISWSRDRGVNDIYLDVYTENGAAVRAYEKAGFTPLLLEMKLESGKQ
ncbi:MAG: GNAT family N-acetyltransferase [Woeseiaceae bacterium]